MNKITVQNLILSENLHNMIYNLRRYKRSAGSSI